ncbi:MAG: hypothetical protein JOZ69_05765 [Myxococcales bacterium]|nr:hypothetical protein [Myxococcales bacterium]
MTGDALPVGRTLRAKGARGEYRGPERRRHRVFVTRNTEYHFRDGFCIAVRDRRTGEFLHGHLALSRPVHGGIRFFPNGAIAPNTGEPRPGESLYFASDGRDLVTSPLEHVERPSKELVLAYTARRSG